MTEFCLLRAKIMNIGIPRRYFQRHAFDDFETVVLQTCNFTGVVGQQANLMDTEIAQHLRADAIIPQIFFETELKIRFYGVPTLILQGIGFDLVGETDTSPLLVHINQNTFALLVDKPEGLPNLIAAIATLRPEYVARQAFRMHTNQNTVVIAYLAFQQSHMFGVINLIAVHDRFVHAAVNGWEYFFCYAFDQALTAQTIGDQAGYRDDFHSLCLGNPLQGGQQRNRT